MGWERVILNEDSSIIGLLHDNATFDFEQEAFTLQ